MDFGLGVLLDAKDLWTGTFQRAGASFRQFEGATSASGKKITDNLKLLGTGIALFSAGAAGLAALSVASDAFAGFQQRIAEISTLTDEASLSTGFLSAEVLTLNTAYGGGTAAQAKALYDGISAGAGNAAQATALLNVSNRAAVAGVTEVGVALDGLTSAMNAYGVSFEQAGSFSDAFFVGVQKGKTTLPELAGVIGRVAPTANSLKVSFDEVVASLAAVTAQGLKTDEATTGLKAVFANVLKPTKDASTEAKRLGIEFTAASLRAQGLRGFLDSITSSAKFNDDSMAKLFGSVEALNTVLALTAQGGAKWDDALAAMAGKAGATDAAFAKMEATLAFQQKRFDGLKESALIMIGEALEPAAAATVRLGNALLEAFNAIPGPVRTFLVQLAAGAATLLTVVGGAIALKAAIGILSAGLTAAGVSLGSLLATMAPALLVIGAMAAAFVALRLAYERNLGGLGDRLSGFVGQVKLLGAALSQAFEQGGFSGAVKDELDKADNQGLKSFVIRVYTAVARIQEFFRGLADGFGKVLEGAQPHFTAFRVALEELGKAFGGMFAAVDPKGTGQAFEDVGKSGASMGEILGRVAVAIVDALTIAINIVAGFAQAWGVVRDGASGVLSALQPLLTTIGEVAVELGLADDATNETGAGWRALGSLVASVVGVLLNVVRAGVSGIAGYLSGMVSIIGGVIQIVQGIISGDWSKVWAGAARVVYGMVSSVLSLLGGMVEQVAAIFDGLAKAVGKDLGLAAKVQGIRTGLDSALKDTLGLGTGEAVGRLATGASIVAAPNQSFATPAPATAIAQNAAAPADALFATVAALREGQRQQAPAAPPVTVVKVSLDSEQIASKIEATRGSEADRTYASGIPQIE